MSWLNKHAQYDSMSTEALNDILRQDFLSSGSEKLDVDDILYITQLLVNREDENPTGRFGDTDASWQNFRQKFIAFDDTAPGGDKSAPPTRKRKAPTLRTLRIVLIAAAVTAVFIGAAYAAGILDWLPRWTGEHFTFTSSEDAGEANSSGAGICADLEQALSLHNAPDDLVPAYIPDGYELIEFDYSPVSDTAVTFGAFYSNGENTIALTYWADSSGVSRMHTKDEGEPEVYTTHGIDHYIMTNAEQYIAVWKNADFECCISGFESRKELIKTIHSMY